MVTMKIGGQTVDFMVDTEAEHSVVTQKVAPLLGKEVTIIGATGDQTHRPFCHSRQCQLGGHQIIHEFLYLPDCPVPLMGRDLLAKMGAEITFAPDGSPELHLGEETSLMILSLSVLREEEWRLYIPQTKASSLEPELEKEFLLVWAEGNPPGLAKDHALVLIDGDLLNNAGLHGTHLSCLSKSLGLRTTTRAINEVVITLHSALPNPYTLLGLIPSEAEWFTCLDLKDAFFCLQLAPSSQPLFAFEWENPTTGAKEQFTWTRLPQGFKNSPTLFSRALASDLSKFPGQDLGCVLLQYVDNLLLASSTLGTERKQAICAIPVPTTRWQIREFLGVAGFCRNWIPGFSDLAKPLYEALREEKAPIDWGPEQEKAFITIKTKLTETLALGLPDVMQDFNLFVHENSGVALGVLTQEFGPWQRPVAYLSKRIDPVASGWPPCLRALAATALLVKEVHKLILGQNLNVKVPHAVVTLMEARGQHRLTHARMTQYQGLLCENLLGTPEHDCLEVLEEVYSSRPDLRDRPLQNADLVLFTDSSRFLDEGKRRARYAVVSDCETSKAQALPEGWSAQRAELWALVRALELSKNKRANIYTDSCYAFATLHVHGAIYKERGLLTAGGKGIKNQNEILKLLEAVRGPKEISVIHCKGHQKGKDSVSEGNQRADTTARLAAKEQAAPAWIKLAPELPEPPKYTPQEEKWAQKEGGKRTMEGWWILPDHRVYVPEQLSHKVVLQQHELTHLGKAALEALLGRYYLIANLPSLCASVSQHCLLCAQNNAKQGPVGGIGVQHCG
ncbi:hypothetical protein QTO34_018251 [Cnephaeus nilssonii]|uniref:Uncharacterized protein n=1 Tax=Cnephaeus nilssonii TaxID=3371016 RepID=A0AA40HZ79_CNENI|nr:hypothetical protein QTO34_018251 [Eptesicus nilssonii]